MSSSPATARDFWSNQFTPTIVRALHAGGLKVCAWQYVYGDRPVSEANLGAEAVHDGADCLVIDAEAQYQGRYSPRRRTSSALRSLIGPSYPVALAGFPYVDYHPSFPYSVFLGPGGAQYNVPQMYWRDIGTSVAAVFAHTYSFNRIYQRPIFPLGQLYSNPPPGADRAVSGARPRLRRRRRLSWWDWQSASAKAWSAMSLPIDDPARTSLPTRRWPSSAAARRATSSSGPRSISSPPGYPVKISGEFKYRTYTRSSPSRPSTASRPTARSDPRPGRRCCATGRCTSTGRWTPQIAAAGQLRTAAASARAGGSPTVTLPVAAVGVRSRPAQRDPGLARRRSLTHAGQPLSAQPPSSVVPASSVVGWSTDTDTAPSTIMSAPNVTSPETTSRSACLSDGGPAGNRRSNSSISL